MGVSNPTNFVHKVHVGFDPRFWSVYSMFLRFAHLLLSSSLTQGMPEQWSKLLTKSAITREDYAKDPQAVLEVLEFYTDHQKREMEENAAMSRAGPSGSSYSDTSAPARFNAGTGLGGMGKLNSPLPPSLSSDLSSRPGIRRQDSESSTSNGDIPRATTNGA